MKQVFFRGLFGKTAGALVLLAAACASPTPTTAPAEGWTSPTGGVATAGGVTLVTVVAPTDAVSPLTSATVEEAIATCTSDQSAVEPAPVCSPWFDPAAFLPDGVRLVGITRQEGKSGAQVINLETGQIENFIPAPYAILKSAVSPDGELLAWALEDYVIRLVRLADGAEVGYLEGHIDRVTGLEFSMDGERLVSTSIDGWVRVWSLTGELLLAFRAGETLGMGLAPDGVELVTIHFDGPAKAWNLESGKLTGEYAGSIGGGYDGSFAEFSPDGNYVGISYGAGGAATLWRAVERAELWKDGLMAIALSPDNRTFAAGEMDAGGKGKVVLRALDDQAVIREFDGHAGMVWKVLFSPDGKLLSSTDGVDTFVWRASDGEPLQAWGPACP